MSEDASKSVGEGPCQTAPAKAKAKTVAKAKPAKAKK
jgi:hypothetical protein